MATLHLRNGTILDPSQGLETVGDLWIVDGKLAGINVPPPRRPDQVLDCTGKLVCPGLIDLHVSLREPGDEDDETISSGTAAALAGGFTSVVCLPDTKPVVDNRSAAEFIRIQGERARHTHVFPLGAVTKDCAGLELAEMGQLVEGGVRAFSDGRNPVSNPEIMRRALQYAGMWDCPIFHRPVVVELVQKGVMHDGYISTRLGLPGIPAAAEEIMVGRDIALCELTGGRVHLMCISTKRAVERIREAKAQGLKITCEIASHQLAFLDEALEQYDANLKVDPPFRTLEHREALIAGLQDGTIDVICSDHQPHAPEKKMLELDQVPFGIVGLETLLPVCVMTLIEPGHLTWLQLMEKLTWGPARILGLDKGTLRTGAVADVTVIDPGAEWVIDPQMFRSKSRNTPFGGWKVRGRASTVIVSGEVRYQV